MIGRRFGRVVVLSGPMLRKDNAVWRTRCDCGAEFDAYGSNLRRGKTKSCGCLQKELLSDRRTHGDSIKGRWATEYRIYAGMLQRCENTNTLAFKWYGARGIKVCDRWRESYENFLEDMGRRPTLAHSIDRINNDGNYEPGNCRWATIKQQAQNRRPRGPQNGPR
jgi:hypothetical protein